MAFDPIQILISAKDEASAAFARVRDAVSVVTDAIKSKLDLESSEIAVQRKKLDATQAEQQSLLQIAKARGDEMAAAQAREALRDVEAKKLDLVAQAKMAEAAALEKTTAAMRDEMAVVGPLTQQQQQRLQVAENAAKSLELEAQAARQSAQSVLALGQAQDQATAMARANAAEQERAVAIAQASKQAVDQKAEAIKRNLEVERSEIELQRQTLDAANAVNQSALKAAKAKGDEVAAMQAANAMRQNEGDQLALLARVKRAEATAIQQAVEARREELAAIGPLAKAHSDELRAAENQAKSLRVQAAAADQAAGRARAMGDAVQQAGHQSQQSANGIGALSLAVRAAGAAMAAAFTVREMVAAAAGMETLQTGLQAVSGSAEKAGQDMDFVRRMAGAAGVDVVEAGRAFLGLSAATKGTAVEGEATRAVFEAVTVSMARAGKSSAETSNALTALAQMAGKGKVQMEELRGQLGEALPGALNAAAKGLGITTQELSDLVEKGQITAQDLFPALTKGLNELYGSAGGAQTLAQEITNVKNAFADMAASIGDNGGLAALKVGAEVAQTAITLLGDALVSTGKTIGVLMGAVATLDFSGVKQAFADIEAESRDKLLKAAEHNGVLAKYIGLVGSESTKAALAQQQAGSAAAQAGQQASAAADQWIQLNNGYGQVLTSVRAQIEAQEKSVIARDAEGKASVALAGAFGAENEKREAQAQAAATNAKALQDLALLRQTELATMQAQLAALQQEAAVHGKLSNERAKQVAELQKQIELRQQDADKATAQASAARLVAEQARAQSEALRDNSARVGEYRAALEAARVELERVRAAKVAGLATDADVEKSQLALGRAALLYRDALQDQLKAVEAKANLQRVSLDVEAAGVQLAIEQQRAIYEIAKARGDERTAMQAQNEIRRLEIELLRLSAEAKRLEADAALATAQAKKAELIASGEYTGAKKLEIEAAIKAAEVKRLEADIADTTANKLRDLAAAQSDLKGNTEDATNSLLKQAGALERLGDGVQRVGEGFRNKDGMTSDAKGNVQQQWVWTRASIIEYLEQAGLDKLLAEDLSRQFVQPNGTVNYTASAAQKQWGGKYGTLAEALGKMADYYKYGDGQHEAAQRQQYLQGAAAARTVNLNLNLGGGRSVSGGINTDADGAATLENLMSELERSRRNTGR